MVEIFDLEYKAQERLLIESQFQMNFHASGPILSNLCTFSTQPITVTTSGNLFQSCRFITVLDQWAMTASFYWLLIEGVQLYTLLVVTVLSVKKYFYTYMAFGWGVSQDFYRILTKQLSYSDTSKLDPLTDIKIRPFYESKYRFFEFSPLFRIKTSFRANLWSRRGSYFDVSLKNILSRLFSW